MERKEFLDVAVIGGGMAGLSAGAALFKEAIYKIQIFDQNPPGTEGPWVTYARMQTLRSPKNLTGPALEIPHLTFRAWFEAQWGQKAWNDLGKIPNAMWMDYLIWYGKAMQLPIVNDCKLLSIIPLEKGFRLDFNHKGKSQTVFALKVVLATGRGGFGGLNIPHFVSNLPRHVYAHTSEYIDFRCLKKQKIGVVGVGASGFDAAAVALEAGAKCVDLIMRRPRIPHVIKFSYLSFNSFSHGFYQLGDDLRWEFMAEAFGAGHCPPIESLQRLQKLPNHHLKENTKILKASLEGSQVVLETNHGRLAYDYLILATGYRIDGREESILKVFMKDIALWKDRMPQEKVSQHPFLGHFPYLGPHFEFLPKNNGKAAYLRDLYCFNYGATLSHALLSSDIPAISLGARRLAEGISTDFFIQDAKLYLKKFKKFSLPEFNQDEFF